MTNNFINTDADGDLSNTDNWSLGHTPPTIAPFEDVTIQETPTTGSCTCGELGTTGGNVGGGSWTINGTMTGVTWNAGTNTGTLTASACSFNSVPCNTIVSTGGCSYGTGLTYDVVTIGASDSFGTSNNFSNMVVPLNYNFTGIVANVSVLTLLAGVQVSGTIGVIGSGTTTQADTATFPAAGNTLSGSGTFGPGNGPTVTPTYQRPNNVANDTLAKALIKSGATFGPAGGQTGTYAGSGGTVISSGIGIGI